MAAFRIGTMAHIMQRLAGMPYHQIRSFVVVGGICYAISMLLLFMAVDWLRIEVNLANLVTSIVVVFITFSLNRAYVFKPGRHGYTRELGLFYLFSTTGLVLNVLLMYLMTTYLPLSYLIDKTLIVILIAVFNFTSRKYIIFRG